MSKYVKALDRTLVYGLTQLMRLGSFHDNYLIQNMPVASRGREDVMTIVVNSALNGTKGNSTFSYVFDDHGLVNTAEGTQPINNVYSEYEHYELQKVSKAITQRYMTFMATTFGKPYVIDELEFRHEELEHLNNELEQTAQEYSSAKAKIETIESQIRAIPHYAELPEALHLEYARALMAKDKTATAGRQLIKRQQYAHTMLDFMQDLALRLCPTASKKFDTSNGSESSS